VDFTKEAEMLLDICLILAFCGPPKKEEMASLRKL
jgi:hypothetical protein